MEIKLRLFAGPYPYTQPFKEDVQKNIDALQRVIDGKPALASDGVLHMDTMSILKAIQDELK